MYLDCGGAGKINITQFNQVKIIKIKMDICVTINAWMFESYEDAKLQLWNRF